VRRTLEFRKLHPFTRCFVKVNFFLVQKCVARFFITRVNFYYFSLLSVILKKIRGEIHEANFMPLAEREPYLETDGNQKRMIDELEAARRSDALKGRFRMEFG
jgi:hypothetical protein